MRIGIDIDGVIYPWAEVANGAVVERFGVPDPGPHQSWTWLKECVTPDQWAWLWTKEGQQVTFDRMDTYPGTVEAFDAILGSGHECHFVTHRDPAIAGAFTASFLVHHFGHRRWAGLHVVRDMPKQNLADWDVFIDDKPDTVLDMLIQTRARVFSPVRPWNEDLEGVAMHRLVRYDDPRQVAEWVLSQ